MRDQGSSDYSILVGDRLDQLCIGLYQVQFRFAKGTCLSVESDFRHTPAGQASKAEEILAPKAASLVSLLGTTVVSIGNDVAKSLVMRFSNGEGVEVYFREDGYESLSLAAPGRLTMVR
jgi:hypothetical protein